MRSFSSGIIIFLMYRERDEGKNPAPHVIGETGTGRIYGGGERLRLSIVGGTPLEFFQLLYRCTITLQVYNIFFDGKCTMCHPDVTIQCRVTPGVQTTHRRYHLICCCWSWFCFVLKQAFFPLPLCCFGRIPRVCNRRKESACPPEDRHQLIAYSMRSMKGGGCPGDAVYTVPVLLQGRALIRTSSTNKCLGRWEETREHIYLNPSRPC